MLLSGCSLLVHLVPSPFTNPLGIVQSAPITIGITVTFMFHSFLKFPSKVYVLISLFSSFIFTLWSARMQSLLFGRFSFFCWLSLCWVVWPRLGDPFFPKVPEKFYYYYYYYFTHCKFFTPANAGRLSQESKWQQVSSGHQDSSLYSGQSLQSGWS